MNDKDDEYAETRDNESHYFPRIINRGYDVLIFNNMMYLSNCKHFNKTDSNL